MKKNRHSSRHVRFLHSEGRDFPGHPAALSPRQLFEDDVARLSLIWFEINTGPQAVFLKRLKDHTFSVQFYRNTENSNQCCLIFGLSYKMCRLYLKYRSRYMGWGTSIYLFGQGLHFFLAKEQNRKYFYFHRDMHLT